MALYKTIECNNDVLLGVWKIEETPQYLLSLYPADKELRALYELDINGQRILEKMAVRVLLHNLLPSETIVITYEKSGRPVLNNGAFSISISHTRNYVAVIIGPTQYTLGVDIEPVSERTVKVARRFMGTVEYESLMSSVNKVVSTVCWSAKEVLYKMIGSPVVDFRESISVLPFDIADKGNLNAEILLDSRKTYSLDYCIFDDIALVWGISVL